MNSIFHESKEYRTYILYLPTLTFNVSSNKIKSSFSSGLNNMAQYS